MCEIEGKPSDTIELFLLPPSGKVHFPLPLPPFILLPAGIASCFLFRFYLFNWNRARRAWFPVKCPHSAVNYFGWETETEEGWGRVEWQGDDGNAVFCFSVRRYMNWNWNWKYMNQILSMRKRKRKRNQKHLTVWLCFYGNSQSIFVHSECIFILWLPVKVHNKLKTWIRK